MKEKERIKKLNNVDEIFKEKDVKETNAKSDVISNILNSNLDLKRKTKDLGIISKNAELSVKKLKVANIKVIGVGGAGGNTINRMIEDGLSGVDFIAINTDVQDLMQSKANIKIHIGDGLGAGGHKDKGKSACEESRDIIEENIKDADMVFVTAGMGGGTGTGATPVVCEIAKSLDILTVAIVTKPFSWEGKAKMKIAEEGISELEKVTDALIVVHNDKLVKSVEKKTSIIEAFKIGDSVLKQSVKGISDLITQKGYVNLDFADINSVLKDAGHALIGIGKGTGEHRAKDAATRAISSILTDTSIEGATSVLYNMTVPENFTLEEVEEAAKIIEKSVDSSANVIYGIIIDNNLKDEVYLTVVATGFNKTEDLLDKEYTNTEENILVKEGFRTIKESDNKKPKAHAKAVFPVIDPDIPPIFRRK